MGIFSDRCEKCGNKVKKQARFCNICGTGAPGGWRKCHHCGKWVGVESEFCHSCKSALFPKERDLVQNGVIRREPGVFLQRINMESVKRLLDNELIIEQGTNAIFMEDGKVIKVLEPGVHKIQEGFLARIFTGETAKTFFMVDSGDVALPFNMLGLYTKEEMKLNFYTETIFRFNSENAIGLIENVLKDKRQLSHDEPSDEPKPGSSEVRYDTLWKCMEYEVGNAARSMCLETSIDNLVKDPDIRLDFENKLASTMTRAADRYGLSLVRCASVSFFGKAYDELRDRNGEIETATRRALLEKRARSVVADDKLDSFRSEKELEIQLDQLAYEYDVGKEQMDAEFKIILVQLQHELDLKEQKQDQELKKDASTFRRDEMSEELDHELALDEKIGDFKRAEDSKDFERTRTRDMATHEDKLKKAADGLALRSERSERDALAEQRKLEVRAGKAMDELATVLSPEEFSQYKSAVAIGNELEIKKLMANMTPEQMLAMQAAGNPELASAVANIAKSKADAQGDKVRAELANEKVDLMGENADRMERILDKSLEANAKVLEAKTGDKQTFINQT
ncbi:MAG: hypothetical protein KAG97_00745 [Victivallales bacterium]|nr:hypothetical protein [Victivallales bacterium]